MTERLSGKLDGELGTLISLVILLGMIVLTVAGWWPRNTFHGLMRAILSMDFVEMPLKKEGRRVIG